MFEISFPTHEPVLIIALVMLVVLLAPLIFSRFRIPGIVGLIVAGILVGPHAFGLLERDLTIEVLGTIGLLYIMFLAGLEVNLHEFNKHKKQSLSFGALTFALPQVLGTLMARILFDFDWLQAVLLGSVFASHTLLAYPIVSRLGLSKGTITTTAVGATIITDTAALLVLAVIARSAEGGAGAAFWLLFVTLLAAYTIGVLRGLPLLGRWFFRTVRAGEIADFVFILAAVFTCAFLAELAGVEAIIGAFLAGLALNRLVPEQSPLMNRIRFVGESLFIPFFLISVGMLVDLRVLVSGLDTWFVAGAMTLAVTLTKSLAALATRPLFGYTPEQSWLLFGLTIPQAAATLAAVLIGFNLGLFDERVLNGTIVMILVTCILGPSLVEKYGRRIALQQQQQPYHPSEAPQRILIPLSNPATSGTLVDLALAIRRSGSEEPVFPLAVVRSDTDVAAQVTAGEHLLSHAVMHAVAADVPTIPMTRVDMNVAGGILRAVTERRISHIVIGWGGVPSTTQRIFGSILDRLLEMSRETLLVCRLRRPLNTMQRILLAVPPILEREPGFDEVLDTVKQLAHGIGVHLTVLVHQAHQETVEQHVRAARPSVPLTFIPLESYSSHLIPTLTEQVTRKDLVVLLSARESQISWQPVLDRMPGQFAQRFPEADFVVVYPSAHASDLNGSTQTELPPARIIPDLPASTASDALHHMMADAFPNRPDVQRTLIAQLMPERDTFEQEITPGVVLLHAHTSLVSRQVLLAGTSREGIAFPLLERPARFVFVLLNPAALSPEAHLRTLAQLAQVVHSAEQNAAADGGTAALISMLGERSGAVAPEGSGASANNDGR